MLTGSFPRSMSIFGQFTLGALSQISVHHFKMSRCNIRTSLNEPLYYSCYVFSLLLIQEFRDQRRSCLALSVNSEDYFSIGVIEGITAILCFIFHFININLTSTQLVKASLHTYASSR